jgi:hypothetical protein
MIQDFPVHDVPTMPYALLLWYRSLVRAINGLVAANAGTAALLVGDDRSVITNQGDTDGSVVILPEVSPGLRYTVYVQTAQTVTVTAAAGNTIRIVSNVTAAGGSITSNVVGSYLTVYGINTTEWVALSVGGSWTF